MCVARRPSRDRVATCTLGARGRPCTLSAASFSLASPCNAMFTVSASSSQLANTTILLVWKVQLHDAAR
jgi:hypothetical protein